MTISAIQLMKEKTNFLLWILSEVRFKFGWSKILKMPSFRIAPAILNTISILKSKWAWWRKFADYSRINVFLFFRGKENLFARVEVSGLLQQSWIRVEVWKFSLAQEDFRAHVRGGKISRTKFYPGIPLLLLPCGGLVPKRLDCVCLTSVDKVRALSTSVKRTTAGPTCQQ